LEIASFFPKRPTTLHWSNTCISPKKTIYVRSCSMCHSISLWELS
jgi:hypothetical protein